MNEPVLIAGGSHSDARGVLRFCNGFDMVAVRRLYTISNSAEQPVRGWIGHKQESKWFFPLSGKTEIVVETMDAASSANTARQTYTLDASNPAVLHMPPNNWFCIKQDGNAEVMVFSDCTVGQYDNDDYRRPYEET